MTERFNRVCANPLRDGSRCHGCRVFDALMEAEQITEPEAYGGGYLHIERCLGALAEGVMSLLAEYEDEDASTFLASIYRASRRIRATEIKCGEIAAGHA